MSKILKSEKELVKILLDPVLWAENTLRDPTPGEGNKPLRLRWSQKKILRDKSKRIVARWGRRVGKSASMVVYMLWYAFTHEDSVQITATPYDNQIALIFEMLHKFIQASPELKDSFLGSTKSPWEIKFKNGAMIKGFTAGTKSGNEGGSLRGQRADVLYMDEIDYMTDGDFETIFAIVLEDPERIKCWISSTPTGRRGKFFKACTGEMPGWREHYCWAGMENPNWKPGDLEYDRMANPNWSVTMEAELRGSYSGYGYQHEILAEFGEETVGVFKKEYIDRAKKDYDYIGQRTNMNPIMLGVDWDKYANATQMVVMQYLDSFDNTPRFQIINRIEIPSSEYTFDNAVKKIIELNTIYDFDKIYLDRGYGEYQIETLRIKGQEDPSSGLMEKIVGVSFGSAKTIIDPTTKEEVKKPMKAFMIDQLTIMFERDMMIINSSDEEIIRQLENYRMLKKTQNGAPVFTDEDEHTVDCISLCMLGFVENFPELTNTLKAFKSAQIIKQIKITDFNPLQKKDKDTEEFKTLDVINEARYIQVPVGTKSLKSVSGMGVDWAQRGNNSKTLFKRSNW